MVHIYPDHAEAGGNGSRLPGPEFHLGLKLRLA